MRGLLFLFFSHFAGGRLGKGVGGVCFSLDFAVT